MNTELIKNFVDACHDARKITELMPELPQGMKPRHIHVINTVYLLNHEKEYVKVSDISEALKVTKPSITKLINELEERNVLIKSPESNDKRITSLKLTPLGEKYWELYVFRYHRWLSDLFADIPEEEMAAAIQTIIRTYKLIQVHKDDFDTTLK